MDAKIEKATKILTDRKGERGAALVTVMMISFLLLTASIALILETSMHTVNVTDATSEEQAYYAAESGIQSVVDALRHDAVPNPLVDPGATPLPSGQPAEINRLDYRKAVDRRISNATCDPTNPIDDCTGLDAEPNAPRMSRWLPYSWGPQGGTGDANPDRVVLGDPATYSPMNGFAYSVEVSDPDNTAESVSFSVNLNKTGIDDGNSTYLLSRTFYGTDSTQNATVFTRVDYIPPAVQPQTVPVGSGSGTADIGSFLVTHGSDGPGIIPGGNDMARLKITLAFTQPANAGMVIRGYILPAGNPLQPGCQRPTLSYLFQSKTFVNFRSRQTIVNAGCLVEEVPANPPNGPYETYLTGWQIQPAVAQGGIDLEITQPEPRRLMIRSTGYGPRGSQKRLESIIQKNYFDGMGAPSPLTMIGPTCTRTPGSPDLTCVNRTGVPDGLLGILNPSVSDDFGFVPGTSNPIEYTGRGGPSLFQPPIGVTNNENLNVVRDTIENNFGGSVFGSPENIAEELPAWLQNPRNLDRAIQLLREVAQASGSYYGPGTRPPNNAVYGDWATGRGVTVIDTIGGAELNQQSGGWLVVTGGPLTLRGRYAFRGIMVITGPGGLYRSGGGGGNCGTPSDPTPCGRLEGNMIIAPYNSWSLNVCMPNIANFPQYNDKLNCFLVPKYEIDGGGNSDVQGSPEDVATSLNGLGHFVKGVAEK